MKSKMSDNKCHNIDTNNKNDKIPESAPSELRSTTTNKNNHKSISKNDLDKKINNDNINNSMANNINSNSGRTKRKTKITVITTRDTVSIVMRATATIKKTITIAVAKKITSTVVTSTAR